MKRKYIAVSLLLSLFLVSCNENPSSNTSSSSSVDSEVSSTTTSNDVTSSDITSSSSSEESTPSSNSSSSNSEVSTPSNTENSSSSETSDSSSLDSSSEETDTMSIKEIKTKAQEFVDKKDEVGYYESDCLVKLNLQLVATLDSNTPKAKSQYKALMSDGEDYIYVNVDYNSYSSLKKYTSDYSTYEVEGYISLSNDEVEIKATKKPRWLEGQEFDINYFDIAESKSLSEVYTDINNMNTNYKGCAYGKLVKVEVQCLAEDINNTNMIFGNGDTIIGVHGNDKVTNGFSKGSSYTLVGALSIFNQKPGLEYVAHKVKTSEVSVDFSNIETKTTSEFYNYQYIKDTTEKNPKYTNLFMKPYKVSGYANYYMKNNRGYMVIDSAYNADNYVKYENARSKKSLFINNETYKELTDSNSSRCPLFEYANVEEKFDFVVFPYLWNSQKYPMVYVYNFTSLTK